MADDTIRGRFVWHELMTPKPEGAQAFYASVLGWRTEPWENDPSYTLFVAPSGPLGGSLVAEDGTPQWIPVIGTNAIDETVEQATRLGAAVTSPIATLANRSKYALLDDPQGARFGVYWAEEAGSTGSAPQPGEFSWHELAAADYRAAFDFYSALFGWDNVVEHDMGPMGTYLIFGRNGTQLGGMFNRGSAGKPGPAYWLAYVRVKNLERAVSKAKSARGSVLVGPMEVPGGDWIAQLSDPYGTMFAVHTLAADVKGERGEAPPREQAEPAAKKARRKKTSERAAPAEETGGKAKTGRKKAAEKATRKKAAKKKTPAKKKAAKKRTAKKKAAKAKTAKKKASKKKAAKKSAAKRRTKATKAANRKRVKAGRKKIAKKGGRKKAARSKKRTKRTTKKKAKKKRRSTR